MVEQDVSSYFSSVFIISVAVKDSWRKLRSAEIVNSVSSVLCRSSRIISAHIILIRFRGSANGVAPSTAGAAGQSVWSPKSKLLLWKFGPREDQSQSWTRSFDFPCSATVRLTCLKWSIRKTIRPIQDESWSLDADAWLSAVRWSPGVTSNWQSDRNMWDEWEVQESKWRTWQGSLYSKCCQINREKWTFCTGIETLTSLQTAVSHVFQHCGAKWKVEIWSVATDTILLQFITLTKMRLAYNVSTARPTVLCNGGNCEIYLMKLPTV